MILIQRGAEPAKLVEIRTRELAKFRTLGRDPTSEEIIGYRTVAEDLWRSQKFKCCYCEFRIMRNFNDVEHFRPKCFADRRPGHTSTSGYWWLAFTWSNLLFACPQCNRSSKNSRFPLQVGSKLLGKWETDVDIESPLLIDPASSVNPVQHIKFVLEGIGKNNGPQHWYARPRAQSFLGQSTIEVCDLNRNELLEIRDCHVENIVMPQVTALCDAIAENNATCIKREFDRAMALLSRSNAHVALTFDALRHYIESDKLLSLIGRTWPDPCEIGTSD